MCCGNVQQFNYKLKSRILLIFGLIPKVVSAGVREERRNLIGSNIPQDLRSILQGVVPIVSNYICSPGTNAAYMRYIVLVLHY